MFRPATTPPSLLTLILLSALSVLTLNMFLPSLANIAADLDADYALVTFSISGFLLLNGVMLLVTGPIADRYGRRPVLLVACLFFIFASIVAALATTIWIFLAARVVQAVIISASALSSAIVTDTTERDKAASKMAYVAMAMAIAPMLGPMFGGALDVLFGWRANFWAFTVMGLALLWLVWVDLGETNPNKGGSFKSQVAEYPELFRSRRFWGYAFCISFSVGSFFFFIASAPLVSATVFGLSPAVLGIGIGSITAGFFVGSFLSGRYSTALGIMWMILAGRWFSLVGIGLSLFFTALFGADPLVYFAGAVTVGFGNGLTVPNARAGTLAVRPNLAGSAAGLSGTLVVVVGAVLTQLPGMVMNEQNGAWMALTIMFVLLILSLLAGLYVRHVDRQEARAT